MAIKLKAEQLDIPVDINGFLGFLVHPLKLNQKLTDAKEIPSLVGAAFGFKQEDLLKRAASEAVERFCGYRFKVSGFQCLPYEKVKKSVIDLKSVIGYKNSGELLSWVKKEKQVYWTKCVDLKTGIEKMAPACIVYPASKVRSFKRFDKYNSSGMAAGTSMEMANTNAICELIERDSLMCSWLSGGKKTFRVDKEYFQDGEVGTMIQSLKSQNINCDIFCIKSDFRIVTFVTVLKHKIKPYYSFGSGCKMDANIAIQRSIEEAIMIYRSQLILIKQGYKKIKVENLTDHIMSVLKLSNRSYIRTLENLDTISYDEFVDLTTNSVFKNQKELVSQISTQGYSVYTVRLSDDSLENDNYFVTKVLIPGLHPLETNHNNLHLDLRRLKKFTKNQKNKLNNIPHPFG